MKRSTLLLLILSPLPPRSPRPGRCSTAAARQPRPPARTCRRSRGSPSTGAATLVLVQGPAEHIAVEASPRSASVRAQVGDDGTLVITTDDHRRWWRSLVSGPARAPTITLTFRTLQSLRGNGAVKIVAERLAVPRLGIALNGAGSVRIAAIDADELTVSGAGAVKAEIAGRAASAEDRHDRRGRLPRRRTCAATTRRSRSAAPARRWSTRRRRWTSTFPAPAASSTSAIRRSPSR